MRQTDRTLGVFLGAVCSALFLAVGCDDGGNGGPAVVSELAEAVALAGPDQTVGYGVTVTLDGSASHAAGTADDPEGTTPASYAWVKTAGTATISLSSTTVAKPTFTAPGTTDALTFQLTVDGKTDTVTVNVVTVAVSVPEVWVGGYGKTTTTEYTATVSPPDTGGLYSYRWSQRNGDPFPIEWHPANLAANPLVVTTPLITDLKVLPDDFGVLPLGGNSVARANGSRLRVQCIVYDAAPVTGTVASTSYNSSADETDITLTGAVLTADAHVDEYCLFDGVPSNSYTVTANTDTVITVSGDASGEVDGDGVNLTAILATAPYMETKIVAPTTGGNVVPVGAPVFIAGGGKIEDSAGDLVDVTSWNWAGTADLTQPDGSTTLTSTDQVAMLVSEDPGEYYVVCTRTGPAATDTKVVRIRAAEYVGVGSVGGRTPDPDKGECAGCHRGQYANIGDQVTDWEASGHADVFRFSFVEHDGTGRYGGADNFKDISCISCHVVGYDESASADNGGFDDVAEATGVNFNKYYETTPPDYDSFVKEFPTVADKSGIQCENCHGPGSTHSGDTGGTAVAALAGMCAPCHDDHGIEVRQFEHSPHTGIDVGHGTRQSCARCHAGNGLPHYLRTGESPTLLAEHVGEKSCGTCHDTHALTTPNTTPEIPDPASPGDMMANPARHMVLRADGEVELPNGVKHDFGDSAVCAYCHNGRRDTRDMAALAPSMAHHGSQQAVMLAGTGAFEFAGYTYVNGPHTAGVASQLTPAHCNDCHMAQKLAHTGRRGDSTTVGGHTWNMTFGDGTETVLASEAVPGSYTNPITVAGTNEFAVAEGSGPSFVGLVEVGDLISFNGDDVVTDLPVAAIMSSFSILVGDATDDFAGSTNITAWSIVRNKGDAKVELVEGCNNCHSWAITTLAVDVGGATKDWDGTGGVKTVQARIQNLLDDLLAEIEDAIETEISATAGTVTLVDYRKGRYEVATVEYDFPGVGDTEDTPGGGTTTWDAASNWENIYKATYNYFFVWQDHSGGIHNPGYSVGLLRSSIEALGGTVGGVDYTAIP